MVDGAYRRRALRGAATHGRDPARSQPVPDTGAGPSGFSATPGRLHAAGRRPPIPGWAGLRAASGYRTRGGAFAGLNLRRGDGGDDMTDLEDPAWLLIGRELRSIAQIGLTFCRDPFDRQRYERIQELAAAVIAR